MKINQGTAISTSHILLVPYEAHHVPAYHSWMKDEELQVLTASEPLSLPEEYAMQQTWRADPDKLTFIACLPLLTPSTTTVINLKEADGPDRMLGDINLFLTPTDADPTPDPGPNVRPDLGSDFDSAPNAGTANNSDDSTQSCTGELEVMIAPRGLRRRGYGRAATVAFLTYIEENLERILAEYGRGIGAEKKRMRLSKLRVKIGVANRGSIGLFESLGFVATGEGENYFGEVELVYEGLRKEHGVVMLQGMGMTWGAVGYREMVYGRSER